MHESRRSKIVGLTSFQQGMDYPLSLPISADSSTVFSRGGFPTSSAKRFFSPPLNITFMPRSLSLSLSSFKFENLICLPRSASPRFLVLSRPLPIFSPDFSRYLHARIKARRVHLSVRKFFSSKKAGRFL